MPEQFATRDRNRKGGWSVPVGSVIKDELKACDHCGHDVNVLTVRTAGGFVVMADDIGDHVDDDTVTCARCVYALGPDE
jgi:hypothetical protein